MKGLNRSNNCIPSYELSGFVRAFKIWILESCEQSILWWNKEPNVIPKALVWSRKEIFNRCDYKFLFGKELKVNSDLTATISELKSDWYINFRDFFMVYLPRNPPIIYNDLYEDYLNKLFTSRKRAKIATKDIPIIHRCDSSCLIKEIRLKDNVITQLNTRVLDRERNAGYRDNLDFRQYFVTLSEDLCAELKKEFIELTDSPLFGIFPSMQDQNFDDDVIKEYLIQEEIRLRAEQEESLPLQE
ncbi:hypothetical protein Tco_1003223 [Tanacetum coccineum]|uniref:Ycf1 n=1 Tax=Tanacetum coccineum TaxID=301880 RepID=A0ABQ5F8U2_9ASTR